MHSQPHFSFRRIHDEARSPRGGSRIPENRPTFFADGEPANVWATRDAMREKRADSTRVVRRGEPPLPVYARALPQTETSRPEEPSKTRQRGGETPWRSGRADIETRKKRASSSTFHDASLSLSPFNLFLSRKSSSRLFLRILLIQGGPHLARGAHHPREPGGGPRKPKIDNYLRL